MFYKRLLVFISLLSTMLLSACQSHALYNQTTADIADVKAREERIRHHSDESVLPASPMLINQGPYVDRTPIDISRQPVWLRNQIVMRGDKLPFSYYSRAIASGGGPNILTRYQTGLDPSLMITLNYTGTVKGALDLLSAKTGYIYIVNGRNVYWQAFMTKTFDIAFMPGSSDYMMGKASGGGSQTPNTAGSSGSAGGQVVVTGVTDDSAAMQYSSLKGTLSVWKDLKDAITQLLSPEGRVMVSEATTSVTVRDKPSNIELISRFISNLNSNLSKQVLVKVQVLEVQLSSTFSYGINWNVVGQVFRSAHFTLVGTNSEPIAITTLGNTAINALTTTVNTGGQNQVSALVNALSQQGRVSMVTEPRVVALNNQVSVIRIVSQQGYLASVSSTTVPGSSGVSGTITSTVVPGNLVTGLTLYVLPKILGNKVYMQVNADISANSRFTTVSTGNVNTNPQAVQIQVPNLTQKQFNQRSVINSGDTLILSGFRQIQNETGASQLFDSQALGGQSATQFNSETIVLITPIILRGCA